MPDNLSRKTAIALDECDRWLRDGLRTLNEKRARSFKPLKWRSFSLLSMPTELADGRGLRDVPFQLVSHFVTLL
jgi:hypothetical protein